MIDETLKRQKKVDRITKQVIDIKYQISQLQDDLQLRFDKLRDLGVKQNKLEDIGQITETTSEKVSYDMKELAKEVGQEIVDKYKKITSSTFYRTTIDKKYFER